jgi:hypothetical protein
MHVDDGGDAATLMQGAQGSPPLEAVLAQRTCGQANLIDLFGRRPILLAVAERFQYATQLWLSRQLVNSQSTRWQEGILLKNPPPSFETDHAEPSRSILRLFQQNQEGLPDP